MGGVGWGVEECTTYYMIVKDSEQNHSMKSLMGGTPPRSKDLIEIYSQIKVNLCRYRLKTFEAAKGKKERLRHQESNPGTLV